MTGKVGSIAGVAAVPLTALYAFAGPQARGAVVQRAREHAYGPVPRLADVTAEGVLLSGLGTVNPVVFTGNEFAEAETDKPNAPRRALGFGRRRSFVTTRYSCRGRFISPGSPIAVRYTKGSGAVGWGKSSGLTR